MSEILDKTGNPNICARDLILFYDFSSRDDFFFFLINVKVCLNIIVDNEQTTAEKEYFRTGTLLYM